MPRCSRPRRRRNGSLDALGKFGIEERLTGAVAFARARQVLLVRHKATGVPIDVTLAWLPFEEEAIAAGIEVTYAGVTIRVLRAEDLVIYKLVARRPRDITDAEELLALHQSRIDLVRVRKILAEFCATIEDDESLVILDRLVGAARRT